MIDLNTPVPAQLQHHRFLATPLTADVAELDYTSYMASPEVIHVHSDGRWLVEGFTFAENLALVARHQADHDSHRAFAFVLLTPSQAVDATERVLHSSSHDCLLSQAATKVRLWVRAVRCHRQGH